VDGDTGHGNFNNVRRFVKKIGQRGIAGVCFEDKLFPKTNSFIGEVHPLADVQEFSGRIKAAKDHQVNDDFVVVARVEALIAGHSMDEALFRAEAYRSAGADAILIHSKKSHPQEILEFARRWEQRGPLVIVPTKYFATPTETFRAAGISAVIWANHLLRSAVTAMRMTAERILSEQSLVGIEPEIASLTELFAMVEQDELEAAEARYLPGGSEPLSQTAPAVSAARV
jgi:phosphoenolpyruvate phosphomutase